MKRGKSANIIRRVAAVAVALLFLFCATACEIDLGIPDVPERPVKEPEVPTGIHLFVSSAEIGIGGQFLLSAESTGEDVVCISLFDSVATVKDGVVIGVDEGETVVSMSDGTQMSTCTVTVKSSLQGVKVTSADANLTVGDVISFTTGLPQGYEAEWSSSDEEVATAAGGTVRALSPGEAEITAVCGEFSEVYKVLVMAETQNPTPSLPSDPNNPNRPHIPSTPTTPTPTRQLLWSDEFDGDTLDETKWEYQLGVQDVYVNQGQTSYGPWFWGNNELQYYTKDAVSLAEGIMTFTAERKSGLPENRQFTSARISTRDRGYWTYGYFEARMKLPLGTGMWPAFWLLPQPEPGMGTNNKYGGWAANGEIDIMEAKGRLPNEVAGTLHFGGGWPSNTYRSKTKQLSTPISEWHTYGFEWRKGYMAWFVDGVQYYRMENTDWYTTSPNGAGNATAPFDVPFYIVFDLAVGGNFDGGRSPDESFTSAAMEVDYVRVYA